MAMSPFSATHGPRDAKIVLVGEAWREHDASMRKPFLDQHGVTLARMIHQAGLGPALPSKPFIDKTDMLWYWRNAGFLVTTVLALRPPEDNFSFCCCSSKELPTDVPASTPLSQGKYLQPQYLPELDRLRTELEAHPRNLIIALGGTACWATLGRGAISSLRGVVHAGDFGKTLPTYHPGAVLSQWNLRPIVVTDFMKAQREQAFPEIRRPRRAVLINPWLEEIRQWMREYRNCDRLAVDIETRAKQITCLGFAPSDKNALVVPFWRLGTGGPHYWDEASEKEAWALVREILEWPAAKVFQNGVYDLQYLFRRGICPVNCAQDTMLAHHALFPEMQKGLGFLASLYADEGSWKLMRGFAKEELKKDD
jgi:uracil-DNA glycosylase